MMSMYRFIAPFILVTSTCSLATADYRPPPLFDMVGCSDLVAVGRVQALKQDTYLLKIGKVLVGESKTDVIEIVRFRDWLCSWRWASYRVGQRLVVFVDQNVTQSNELNRPIFSLRSAGCESEFPIEDDYVFCYTVYDQAESRYHAIGRHQSVYRAKLTTLVDAISDYGRLYRFKKDEPAYREIDGHTHFLKATRILRQQPTSTFRFPGRRSPITFSESLAEYAGRSGLHRFLVDTTEIMAIKMGVGDIGWRVQLHRRRAKVTRLSAE